MKRKKYDEIFPLGEDRDIVNAVVRWAMFRYAKMIGEYKKAFSEESWVLFGENIWWSLFSKARMLVYEA